MGVIITAKDEEVFKRTPSTGRINSALRRVMVQQHVNCCGCGNTVGAGRPLFAGYDKLGSPILRCSNCATDIAEMATPVYNIQVINISVDESKPLWRYMDLAKFASMLSTSSIHFTRARDFNDPFEGAAGLASRQEAFDKHYIDFFKEGRRTLPPDLADPPLNDKKNARRSRNAARTAQRRL